jgi:hypothetical protein
MFLGETNLVDEFFATTSPAFFSGTPDEDFALLLPLLQKEQFDHGERI